MRKNAKQNKNTQNDFEPQKIIKQNKTKKFK